MYVLIVEDEPRLAAFLAKGLREEGHVVDLAPDGVAGLSLAHVGDYDVIVLDVLLPGRNGFEVTASLRADGKTTPILMLTARDEKADVVRGLDVGADDYLTKPFEFSELLARLRALARRAPQVASIELRFADVVLDQVQRTVHRGGTAVALTPTEFRILEVLMRAGGGVVSRTELLHRVWGMTFDPGTSLIDVHMNNVRKKLEIGGRGRLILAVKGVGFRLGSAADSG